MAGPKFDTTKPSHWVGAVAGIAFAVFLVYELATTPDIVAVTTLKSLALGSVYALIALGFVLIFKATEVVNFSQGALAMVGALFISFMVADENLPIIGFFTEVKNPIYLTDWPTWLQWGLSVIVALMFMALLGLFIKRHASTPRPRTVT